MPSEKPSHRLNPRSRLESRSANWEAAGGSYRDERNRRRWINHQRCGGFAEIAALAKIPDERSNKKEANFFLSRATLRAAVRLNRNDGPRLFAPRAVE
jgi:hypothetical protein